jgi:hypothetical protein
MPGFPRRLDNETFRKSDGGARAKELEGRDYSFTLIDNQIAMV